MMGYALLHPSYENVWRIYENIFNTRGIDGNRFVFRE